MRRLRVAAAQINCRVGDLDANTARIVRALEAARTMGADIVAFPELAVTGYPPEDLLLKPDFIAANLECLSQIAKECRGIVAVIGFVDLDRDLYNAAAICSEGSVHGVYHKTLLPNYGVFDERRYFLPGNGPEELYVIAGVRVGVSICEDVWAPDGPVNLLAEGGAEVVININSSPYHRFRYQERNSMLATRAADAAVALLYVNLVGGQDELVFDGQSLAYDASGHLVARARQFEEDLLLVDLDAMGAERRRSRGFRGWGRGHARLPERGVSPSYSERAVGAPSDLTQGHPELASRVEPCLSEEEEVWAALVLGVSDYVTKNGFRRVFVGLSGGIDSSVVCAIAVDALGAEMVTGVAMPSAISSDRSLSDAKDLAARLGVTFLELPIAELFDAMRHVLAEPFAGTSWDVTEENLQARLRGNLLMALSNKLGGIVLTTGNKSELATGYCTLYGDMAGGFAVIKDVPKTLVYRLARYRNERAGFDLIPESVLDKPPSAELRPAQADTDSLPPYDQLDPILEAYIEEDRSPEDIIAAGHDPETVARVARLVDLSEYKRRQAPVGVRISRKAFGKDRRLPITSGYRPPQGTGGVD
jgi:NAD+ synthase (glutamine-hydrolysing)